MTADIDSYLNRRSTPARLGWVRLIGAVYRQADRSVICPDTPRLDGKTALVTGGNGGIGLESCRGLLRRGARVIMACRDPSRTRAACEKLAGEASGDAVLESLSLDLADLDSVVRAADALGEGLDGSKLDVLIANAGFWPRSYARSAQGHEIAFAVNVLGHHLFIRRLLAGEHLVAGGRLVLLTGDIYVFASQCSSDYTYRAGLGGMLAYCRSKLGNLWMGAELHRRYRGLRVAIVHPGVVSTRLGAVDRNGGRGIEVGPLISPERGAQTSLVCATQPDLQPGGYYHNTLGLMQLRGDDPARDAEGASELWDRCEALCERWLSHEGSERV